MRPAHNERGTRQYANLPASVRAIYSEIEYAWLSDGEKDSLVERLTEPEADTIDPAP